MKKKRLAFLRRIVATVTPIPLFLIAVCFMITTANAQSILDRQISLVINDVETRDALQQIQTVADVKFVYSSTAIPVHQKVSVKADHKKLNEVLRDMLAPHAILFDVVDGKILLYKDTQQLAQHVSGEKYNAEKWVEHIVSGVVTDATNEPMPGVNILIKGVTRGTRTDADGAYVISVEDGDVLVFSFIGYKAVEFAVGNKTKLDVVLEQDVATLSEVVVTGYSDVRKESFTGSAITVTGEDIKTFNPVNLLQSLQAFDPSFRVLQNNSFGSNPNKLPEINVRGTTALPTGNLNLLDKGNLRSNPNLPTFILDGFEVSLQTVYDLDMNRIETITFLKDAAATAIYGSRAANGILVIKTKTPKEGQLRINYNYNLSVTAPDLSVYHVLNAAEKLEYEKLAGLYDLNKAGSGLSQLQLDQLYYQKKKNVVSGIDTYWLAEPVRTGIDHNNSLSVSGGSQSIRYSLTARYQNVDGVMKGSGRKRYGADMNLTYMLNSKLSFSNTLSVMEIAAQESPYGSFSDYVKMNPYYVKRDENGNVIREIESWSRQEASGSISHDVTLNPLYDASLSSFNKNGYTLVMNSLSASWNITPALLLKGVMSYQKTRSTTDIFKSPLRNEYYYYSTKDFNKRGEYSFSETEELAIDGNLVLALNKTIGNHSVNASLGANIRGVNTDSKAITAIGFTNDRFDNLGFASAYKDKDHPTGSINQDRLVGSFVSANYSYADKYLLDLVGRLDGSSQFGTQNKTAPFWSAGIGWNVHKETFFNMPRQVNTLKLRATTGLTGDVNFPPYMAKSVYSYYQQWYSTGPGAQPVSYGNEKLKWQRTQNYELGMDLNAFENKVTVRARYYYKLTKDLLQSITVPTSLGFSSYVDNLGELENKGIEINTSAEVFRNRNWSVNLSVKLARNKNQIKHISNSFRKFNDDADEEQGTAPVTRYKEGDPIDGIWAVRSNGIDPETGKEIFVKKDGSLTFDHDVKDIVLVGSYSAKVDGFFSAVIGYKNLLLNLQFYSRIGGQDYNQTLVDRVENADPRYNVDRRVLDQRWKKPGDVALYKNIADRSPSWITSRFVQNNNVLELRSANLSYETSRHLAQVMHMQTLRFGITMNDIVRWSTIKMERGLDYPFARMATFSINATF